MQHVALPAFKFRTDAPTRQDNLMCCPATVNSDHSCISPLLLLGQVVNARG